MSNFVVHSPTFHNVFSIHWLFIRRLQIMEHYYVVTLLLFLMKTKRGRSVSYIVFRFTGWTQPENFQDELRWWPHQARRPSNCRMTKLRPPLFGSFVLPNQTWSNSKKGTLSSRSEFFSSGKKVYSLFIPIRGQSYSGWCKGNQYKWPLRKEVILKLFERPDENRIWNVISRNVLFSFAGIWLSLG